MNDVLLLLIECDSFEGQSVIPNLNWASFSRKIGGSELRGRQSTADLPIITLSRFTDYFSLLVLLPSCVVDLLFLVGYPFESQTDDGLSLEQQLPPPGTPPSSYYLALGGSLANTV